MHLLFVWQIWYHKIVLAERADHQNLGLEYILVVLSAPSAAAAHIHEVTCMRVWELECTLNEKGASFQEPTTVLRKEIPFSSREVPYFPPYFLPSTNYYEMLLWQCYWNIRISIISLLARALLCKAVTWQNTWYSRFCVNFHICTHKHLHIVLMISSSLSTNRNK